MNDLIALHIAHLRSAGMSPRTTQAAVEVLGRLHDALQAGIESTSRAELEQYFGNEKWSTATRECYFNHALRFYRWATDEDVDLIDHNPMARMKRPIARKGEPRPLSDEQVQQILTRAVDPFRLCAVIALHSGLRCIELAGLHKADIGAEKIFIRRAKGGQSATVPSHPELVDLVRDFPEGPVVASAGGHADARWISIRSAVYFSRSLGMKGVSLHRCRHTFASRLRDSGADAFVIKKALRHSSLTSTEIYVGASDQECRQAVRGLAPLFVTPVAC
jgi:integrase